MSRFLNQLEHLGKETSLRIVTFLVFLFLVTKMEWWLPLLEQVIQIRLVTP